MASSKFVLLFDCATRVNMPCNCWVVGKQLNTRPIIYSTALRDNTTAVSNKPHACQGLNSNKPEHLLNKQQPDDTCNASHFKNAFVFSWHKYSNLANGL